MNTMTHPTTAWPVKTGEMKHPLMDSTRWNNFPFRDDDIVVATYSKSGTTLTQQILAQLILDADPEIFGCDVSPWLEAGPEGQMLELAARQTHRRFLKTHLPLWNLVYSPRAKYITVGRDPRDVAWSLHNHFMGFNPEFAKQIELPPPNPDVRLFYRDFLEGRVQDLPYWSHIQSWWDVRALPNLLTLHYADLIGDMPGQIRRIARFLNITLDEARLPRMVEHCSMAHMRKVGGRSEQLNRAFRDGIKTFINKGVNGRWRDVLTQSEIDACDQIAARELTPDCAAWLRQGGNVWSSPA
jgi:aryl sulfotransferase